jgi:hypothetical protein
VLDLVSEANSILENQIEYLICSDSIQYTRIELNQSIQMPEYGVNKIELDTSGISYTHL